MAVLVEEKSDEMVSLVEGIHAIQRSVVALMQAINKMDDRLIQLEELVGEVDDESDSVN